MVVGGQARIWHARDPEGATEGCWTLHCLDEPEPERDECSPERLELWGKEGEKGALAPTIDQP